MLVNKCSFHLFRKRNKVKLSSHNEVDRDRQQYRSDTKCQPLPGAEITNQQEVTVQALQQIKFQLTIFSN